MEWSGGTLALSVGDVVMPEIYTGATASQRERLAFLADASEAGVLGAGDAPHHYSS
jgi:hypothetical protein